MRIVMPSPHSPETPPISTDFFAQTLRYCWAKTRVRLFTTAFGLLVFAAPAAHAQLPAQSALYPYEFIFRQDPTGEGSFHRLGMFRSQKKAIDDALGSASSDDAAAESDNASIVKFTDSFSGQFRANTMLFASNNIFNTENNRVEDGQLAEFVGASLNWAIDENFSLSNTYDAAVFFHGKSDNSDSDFSTSTFRQQLAYERFLFNNKASISLPVSWQFSEVFSGQGNDRLVGTYTYATGFEFSAFPTPWLIPSASYTYLYSDPSVGSGKHKHDFNLGATFIPMKDVPVFIIPSVQYSHENFQEGGRKDNAWTPTLSVSWSPLKYLAFDAVASYTDSSSNISGSSFEAVTTTVFARLFVNW